MCLVNNIGVDMPLIQCSGLNWYGLHYCTDAIPEENKEDEKDWVWVVFELHMAKVMEVARGIPIKVR